jgi:hypothetical protein
VNLFSVLPGPWFRSGKSFRQSFDGSFTPLREVVGAVVVNPMATALLFLCNIVPAIREIG